MEPPFVKFDVLWTAVDLRAAGVGPSVAEIEALGTMVAVEEPEAGVGEAVGDEAVERSSVQRNSDSATPMARIEVERVQIAQRGIGAVGGDQGRADPGEADDPLRAGRHDDACPWLRSGESVGPLPFAFRHRQGGEDLGGHQASIGGTPGRDVHGGKTVGVGRCRVPEFDHTSMLARSRRPVRTRWAGHVDRAEGVRP